MILQAWKLQKNSGHLWLAYTELQVGFNMLFFKKFPIPTYIDVLVDSENLPKNFLSSVSTGVLKSILSRDLKMIIQTDWGF